MSDEANAAGNVGSDNGAGEPQGNTLLTAKPEGGQKDDAKGAEQKAETKPAEAPKPAEPEPFELTAPDGYPMGEAELKQLNAMCKEAKLSRAQGEAVLKYMHGNYTAWQEGQAAQLKKWAEEARADKEFGGNNFDANVADAKRALTTFDKDGRIRAMLEETGYGNHPDVLKIFARVGKALGEDRLVGTGGSGKKDTPLEDRMWPNMQ